MARPGKNYRNQRHAASTHYIHVRVPFNFSRLTLMPDIIFDRYHRYIEVWPEPSRTQVEEVAELSRSCLADKNQLDALPQYEVVTRNKRFLDLVALGMSSAALTLATFNSQNFPPRNTNCQQQQTTGPSC